MNKKGPLWSIPILGLLILAGCAAPAPTATATKPPAAAITQVAPTATPTKRPLVKASLGVAESLTLNSLPTIVAERKGWFQEEGLDVERVGLGATRTLVAVVSRDIDAGQMVSQDIFPAIVQGQPVQVFANAYVGNDNYIVMRPDVIQQKKVGPATSVQERVNALKGLRIGASSAGGGTDRTIRFLLNTYGVDPDRDVEVTYVGSQADRLAALQRGAVDAVGVTQPYAAQAIVEGFGVQLISFGSDVPAAKNVAWSVLVSRKDAQPDVPEALVRATWRALRFINERPEEARDVSYPSYQEGMSADLFKTIFGSLKDGFPPAPAMSEELYRDTLSFRNATEKGEGINLSYQDFYTPKFVDAAKKTLGY
ncbi:MAG: ABC transporter substrate-binding protein [Chloroflexi bacterium]|nr:ABC transporter substrate-binding protein [Chloroflexota bacterium]